MRHKKKLLLILFCIFLAACKEDALDGNKFIYSEHFITEYIIPSQMKISYSNQARVYIEFDGERAIKAGDIVQNIDTFTALANKYGDLSYNQYIFPHINTAVEATITSITLFCDQDFDDDHPRGVYLDDMATVVGYSVYPYIKNGYKPTNDIMNGFLTISRPVDELEGGELTLFSNRTYIQLERGPGSSNRRTITVKVTLDNGTELQASTTQYMTAWE